MYETETEEKIPNISNLPLKKYDYLLNKNIPVYEIPVSTYIINNYENSNIVWQPVEDEIYPDDFYILIDEENDFYFRIKKYIENEAVTYGIVGVYYFNGHLTYDPPLLYTQRLFNLYYDMTNEFYIIGTSFIENLYDGRWIFINSDNIDCISNNPAYDGYELKFYNEENKILYVKTNYKFVYAMQACSLFAQIYTIPDEFFSEKGIVTFGDNGIVYTPTSVSTINEWFLSDEFYFKREKVESQANTIEEFVIYYLPEPEPEPIIYTENEPPIMRYAITCAVPDFLNEEQVELYRRAVMIFPVFSGVSDAIESFPRKDNKKFINGTSIPSVAIQGYDMNFFRANGRYEKWEDFESMGLSIFTKQYFEKLSQNFVNIDEQLYFPDAVKGGRLGYAPELSPDTFELVDKTDIRIEFNVTGYYYENGYAILEGKDPVSTETFPIIMELTDEGWRFSLFNRAG